MNKARFKRSTAKFISGSVNKELVNSWDLFDTLLSRFSLDPKAAFRIIDAKYPEQDFYNRRTKAQSSLDKAGAPYVLHDIYKQMVRDGLSKSHAIALLVEELKVERFLMFPIRSAVELVSDEDIIVSDMYLSEQNISELVWEICGLRMLRPVIRSNWGKSTGTIWPEILRHYEIRSHTGDNLRSDVEIPKKYGIETVLATDTHLSRWEKKVSDLGHQHLALILREARLRGLKYKTKSIYNSIAGPYLTLLYAYSSWIFNYSDDKITQYVFLRRDCEDLSRVFSAMYPFLEVKQIDLTRLIAYTDDPDLNNVLVSQINADSLLIDMVATGRSAFQFIDQANAQISNFLVLIFLDSLLQQNEIEVRNNDFSSGRFHCVTRSSELSNHHYPLECLMQTEYPPVVSLGYDSRSGGVIRSHGKSDLSHDEKTIISEKSNLLQEFMRSIQRRNFVSCDISEALSLIQHSLDEILSSKEILASFPSFLAREKHFTRRLL